MNHGRSDCMDSQTPRWNPGQAMKPRSKPQRSEPRGDDFAKECDMVSAMECYWLIGVWFAVAAVSAALAFIQVRYA